MVRPESTKQAAHTILPPAPLPCAAALPHEGCMQWDPPGEADRL